MASLRNLRYVALVEATTFLVLIAASIVKHTGGTEAGVQIFGPIHGIMFILFVAIALGARAAFDWTAKTTVLVLAGAVVPLGGFAVDRWLVKAYPSEVGKTT